MKPEAETFISQLSQLCEGLWYISETDAPLTPIFFENWLSEKGSLFSSEDVLKNLAEESTSKCEEKTVGSFFKNATTAKDWHSEEEKKEVERFKKLLTFLEENLSDLQVFLIGDIQIKAFVLGKTTFGGISGIKTELVQT